MQTRIIRIVSHLETRLRAVLQNVKLLMFIADSGCETVWTAQSEAESLDALTDEWASWCRVHVTWQIFNA